MSYLDTFLKIVAALRADMASGFAMSGDDETFATWDAYLGAMLGLWSHCPTMSAILAPMTEGERWDFAGENCDDDAGYSLAAMLDSECRICGSIMGDHDESQEYSCSGVMHFVESGY